MELADPIQDVVGRLVLLLTGRVLGHLEAQRLAVADTDAL
jgi:hypothetical protein